MIRISLFIAICLAGFTAAAQTITIAEARTLPEDTEVTVTGTVTNGSELGNIRYFQDGTAGIAAFGSDLEGVLRGDSITMTGSLTEFFGLLEIVSITSLTNHGPATLSVESEVISLNDLDENIEGELVTIELVSFNDGGSIFSGGESYNFSNADGTTSIYVRAGHPLVGDLIPVGLVSLTGLASQFSFSGFGDYQLILRDAQDIANPNPINIISAIESSGQSNTGFTLSWTTDIASSSEAFYTDNIDGNDIEGNQLSTNTNTTNHALEFTDLTPGEVFFVQVFSVANGDTAFSNVGAFATESLMGNIEVYFNSTVATSVASSESNEALQTNLKDTVVAYIDRAQSTLDLAIYNTNNTEIVQAVNAAYERGVEIRYIAEGQTANSALGSLIDEIPVFVRQNSDGSGMHNKFVLVDFADEDSSYVLSGSTNFTNNNLFTDPNNLVIIQDKALAKSYRIEFNEMWGGNSLIPDPSSSRFGEFKLNNTPEKFTIDGNPVELYFSPSDGTNGAIAQALESADASLEFALLVITQNTLSDIIIEKSMNELISVQGIVNDINTTGSDFDEMVNQGVNVIAHSISSSLHHKYAIIDQGDFASDPIVVTGSHNWSATAGSVNDENTLIIHNAEIANQFFQEFTARVNEILSTNSRPEIEVKLYPNPAFDRATLEFEGSGKPATVSFYSLEGKLVDQLNIHAFNGSNSLVLDVSSLPAGIYLLQYNEGNRTGVQRLAISK